MNVGHDTRVALGTAVALVNSRLGDRERLPDVPAVASFLERQRVTGVRPPTVPDLAAVWAVRSRLRAVWSAPDTAAAAAVLNVLLVHADAVPQLTHHDGWDWHLHFTRPGTPVADRLAAEGAMALADLLRAGGHDRLRSCIAPGCQAVLVDLSRNRSRRYCDTGNCGNRVHVAAYRARLRQSR